MKKASVSACILAIYFPVSECLLAVSELNAAQVMLFVYSPEEIIELYFEAAKSEAHWTFLACIFLNLSVLSEIDF